MDVREIRVSDGVDGLPPIYTQKGKKKKKNRSLHTTSAPLTPDASSLLHRSPLNVPQQSRLSMSNSRPVMRRSTVSDAGGQLAQVDAEVSVQLAPILDRCTASSKSTDGGAADTASTSSSGFAGLLAAQQAQSSPRGATGSAPQQPAASAIVQQTPAVAVIATGSGQQQQHFAAPAAPASPAPSLLHAGRPLQSVMSIETGQLAPPPSLWEFFYAEATPHEKYPTADVLWRQTERDRVYNFLLYVPYQLERIMIFGTLLCLYSFLGAVTVLPLRCLRTLSQLVSSVASLGSRGSSSSSSRMVPSGAQLYDLLCVLLLLGAVSMLSLIQPGVIYYWMKDITSEFLKIQVIFTALEILDKILSNFGVDVLEALSSTCTLFTRHSIGLMPLISDFLVAFLLITVHGSVLMCQAMVFAVTMNSKANALLALMIATNFVELKGQVYKRTDTNKLWTLACQDIVERFELLLVLCFVVVEDISNGGTWTPASATLLVCGRIYVWEIIIDIAKHAVLGKFNDIRPGIYREYMRDLCSDSLDNHSHNIHKLVGFCPLGSAALCLRMIHTLFTLKGDGPPQWHVRLAVLLLLLLGACVLQVILGFSLKWLAYLYVQHHAVQAGGKSLPRAINVTPAGAKIARGTAGEKGGAAQAAAAVTTAATGVPGSGLVNHAAAAAGTAAAGRSSGLSSQGQGLPGAVVTAAAVTSAPGSTLNVTQTQSDEGQVACGQSMENRSGQRRPPAAAGGGGNGVHWAEQLPTSPDRNDSSSSSRNKQDNSSSRSSSFAEAVDIGMRFAGTAGAAGLQSDVGLSSSYTAPSQAGVSRRTYTKSVSCADMSNTHNRQPGIVAAQE